MAVSRFVTPFGTVFRSDRCKDDYKNLVTWGRAAKRATLQRPAMLTYKAAQLVTGGFRITGSLRTCEFQRDKFKEDPDRFAHPNVGVHTQGLAIDVHTGDLNGLIRRTLLLLGWKQTRPDDEPWHFSFRVKA